MSIDAVQFELVGRPVLRKEDERLLRGEGEFTDDFNFENQAYISIVRSPYPRARIVKIDSSQARIAHGVIDILTGAEVLEEGIKPIPHTPAAQSRYDLQLTAPGGGTPFIGQHHVLAIDEVRYVGEAVAVVIAESPVAAADAAELIAIEYEELPFVTNSEDAIRAGAPQVWVEAPSNTLVDTTFGDEEATTRAFRDADHVVTAKFAIGRVTAAAMEPRGALGKYDPISSKFTVYAGSGGVVKQKKELAYVLGVPAEKVRVVSRDVGGNFGSKNRPYIEFVLVMWASKKVGRPVKYTASRSETFLTDYQGRDLVTTLDLAIRSDGRFLGLRADNVCNVGAVCVSLSPLYKGASLTTGVYDIPCATVRARAVFSHTMPVSAYRSSGRPEVTFAIERLVDIAAAELGMDRVELRRLNLVAANSMPYENAVGVAYDSGDYEANMDLALRVADFANSDSRRSDALRRGKLFGIGVANYVEASSGAPIERAEISVRPEGNVNIVIGTQPSGQGHETSFSQVAADLLGVPIEKIAIRYGDTDVVSVGGGTHSGRSMRHAGSAIAIASAELVKQGRKLFASIFDVQEDTVRFSSGQFTSTASNAVFDLFELAKKISNGSHAGEVVLAAAVTNEMHEPVFPNGCAVCEVEIDPETGSLLIVSYVAVDDVGRCINPMIVAGQTHGGIAQGIGQAVSEQCVVDFPSGQPLLGSFMDYGVPRADTLPSFKDEIVEILSPTNPLGIKAGGEGGTTPAPAVVVNAVIDALRPFGVRDVAMPVTPHAIWQVLQDTGADRFVRGGIA